MQVGREPGIGGHPVEGLQFAVRDQAEQVNHGGASGICGIGHERRLPPTRGDSGPAFPERRGAGEAGTALPRRTAPRGSRTRGLHRAEGGVWAGPLP
jgi:hypothetical protein